MNTLQAHADSWVHTDSTYMVCDCFDSEFDCILKSLCVCVCVCVPVELVILSGVL